MRSKIKRAVLLGSMVSAFCFIVGPQQNVYGLEKAVLQTQSDTVCKEHTYGSWTVLEEADCTHEGKAQRICKKCGDVQEGIIRKKAHTPGTVKVIKEAACGSMGILERSCSVCGEVYRKESIPALTHEAGDWVITQLPGKLTTGVQEKYCKNCQALLERKEIPSLYTLTEQITLAPANIDTTVGQVIYLNAICNPALAQGQNLTYMTSDPSVAVVDQRGMVYTTGRGEAYITASAFNGVTAVSKICTGFSINYVLNGGENDSKNPTSFYEPAKVSLKNPAKKGYRFEGWYTNASCEGLPITKLENRKNYILYAKWEMTVKPDKVANLHIYPAENESVYCEYSAYEEPVYYQIVAAQNQKFTKEKKIQESTETYETLLNLEKGKTYYIKVRAFQKDSTGRRYYGAYSNVQKITIK